MLGFLLPSPSFLSIPISAIPGTGSWVTATASVTTDDSGSGLVPFKKIPYLKSNDHSEMLI